MRERIILLREILTNTAYPPVFFQALCPIKMPETVPIRPEMAAKTSLLHVPRKAMWATSTADKQTVIAMANFTPRTSFSVGGISIISSLPRVPLRVIFLVKAFLRNLLVIFHLLLSFLFWKSMSSTLQKTCEKMFGFLN